MKKYVIIGNAVAAVGAIEGIRSVDKEGPITVVSEEKHEAYCRPLISYYLQGKTDPERMKYRPEGFYEKNGCTVLYGRKATAIDPEKKTVEIDDGTKLPYDSVCVATGSSPFVPPFKGLDTVEKKFSFMTLDDTLALEKAITPESRVMIVGAGLIGLKCAEGISGRVKSITICDLANRVMPSILDDEAAAIVQKHLENNGMVFMLGDSAAEFQGNKAIMNSGKEVEFDVLVLAVGVRANTSLVKDIGGKVTKGIVINERQETTIPGIYAAGDCVESYDISGDRRLVLAIFPNAYIGGNTAGINMAGGDAVFDNVIPMNSIGFFGLHTITAGSYFTQEQGGQLYEEKGDMTLKRLFTKDGYLTGFMMIGNVDRAGIYTNMIRNRIPLSEVDFDMIKKEPSLLPFGKNYRTAKLGGEV